MEWTPDADGDLSRAAHAVAFDWDKVSTMLL